jgi:hypothetical protein
MEKDFAMRCVPLMHGKVYLLCAWEPKRTTKKVCRASKYTSTAKAHQTDPFVGAAKKTHRPTYLSSIAVYR